MELKNKLKEDLLPVWVHGVALKYHVPGHVCIEVVLFSFWWTHGVG